MLFLKMSRRCLHRGSREHQAADVLLHPYSPLCSLRMSSLLFLIVSFLLIRSLLWIPSTTAQPAEQSLSSSQLPLTSAASLLPQHPISERSPRYTTDLAPWPYKLAVALQNGILPVPGEGSSTASLMPLGETVRGRCEGGKIYDIRSVEQLQELTDELQCVMSVGVAPEVLPLGPAPGKLLVFLNSVAWNPVVGLFYQGQFYTESVCNGQSYSFDFSRAFPGFTVTTALLSLGKFEGLHMEGEVFDDKPCLITDYSVSARDLCGMPEGNESPLLLDRMSPYFNNIWPFTNVKYCIRIVGCDTDGAFLLLKRSFVQTEVDGRYFTLLYAVMKTNDKRLSTLWKCGDGIGPTKAFSYQRRGSLTFLERFAPLFFERFTLSILEGGTIGPLA